MMIGERTLNLREMLFDVRVGIIVQINTAMNVREFSYAQTIARI